MISCVPTLFGSSFLSNLWVRVSTANASPLPPSSPQPPAPRPHPASPLRKVEGIGSHTGRNKGNTVEKTPIFKLAIYLLLVKGSYIFCFKYIKMFLLLSQAETNSFSNKAHHKYFQNSFDVPAPPAKKRFHPPSSLVIDCNVDKNNVSFSVIKDL